MLKKDIYCLSGCFGAVALFSTALLSNPHTVLAQVASIASSAPAAIPSVTPSVPVVPAVPVVTGTILTLTDGTQPPRQITTQGSTVADVLRGAGITISHQDRVLPSLTTPVTSATHIVITRVDFKNILVTQPIPFRSVFKMSKSVRPGTIRKGRRGVPGVMTLTYRAGYINGKRTHSWLVSKVVTRKPVSQQTLGGIRVEMAAALPSRGGAYNRLGSMMMVATGYSPNQGGGGGRCATGMRAGYGVVAVDPRVIRLGSRLYIQGYGYAVAGDTGGAIRGNRIDLGSSSYQQALAVGRRDVRVWVLSHHR